MKRGVCAALALLLCSGGEGLGYPIARERELGERFSLEAASALPMVREAEVMIFIDRIGQGIVDRLGAPQPFDYRFGVVRDPQLNAFAVPGGFIYLHSGLVTRVENDSELAGVLGHEIAHAHAHHIVRQQEKSQLLTYGALAGILLSVIQPALGAAALGASAAGQLKYQRDFEQEADYLGLRFMREAGFEGHGMASFMKRILEEQRMHPLDVPPYMLSHPLTDDRIVNLEAATKDAEPREGWKNPSWELLRAQAILRGLTDDRAGTRSIYRKKATAPPGEALYGLLLLHQGDLPAALEMLERAAGNGQADLDGDIGLALLRSGRIDEAILRLKARVETRPEDAAARASLGNALAQKGDYLAAQRELARALEAAPMLDEAEFNLGQSYGRAGDGARGMFHLAKAFELRGDVERAHSHYERAAKQLPEGSPEAEEAKLRAERMAQVLAERVIGRQRSR